MINGQGIAQSYTYFRNLISITIPLRGLLANSQVNNYQRVCNANHAWNCR